MLKLIFIYFGTIRGDPYHIYKTCGILREKEKYFGYFPTRHPCKTRFKLVFGPFNVI